MSLRDLFPFHVGRLYVIRHAGSSAGADAEMCQRCGSLVIDLYRHYRWHGSVDTGATTALPSDSAPRSSGAGRPNPKDM